MSNLIKSPDIAYRNPHVAVNVSINDIRPIPNVNTLGIATYIPIYSPMGITNKLMKISGEDVLKNYVGMFGKPNTTKYGPSGTYAYNALNHGYELYTINVRPDNAAYANAIVGFGIKEIQDTIFVDYDVANNTYTLYKTMDVVPEELQGTVTPISFRNFSMGFSTKTCEDVRNDDDFILKARELKLLSEVTNATDIFIPAFGFRYEGASEFGNNFAVRINATKTFVNECCPVYEANMINTKTNEIVNKVDFSLTDAVINETIPVGLVSAFDAYSDSFQAIQLDKDEVDEIEELVYKYTGKSVENMRTALLTEFPNFETATSSNIDDIEAATMIFASRFHTDPDDYDVTPLTCVDMTKDMNSENLFIPYNSISLLFLDNGHSGDLKEIVNKPFSWKHKVIKAGDTEPTLIFEELFSRAFNGYYTKKIYDLSAFTVDVIFDVEYPMTVQKAIGNLCLDREGETSTQRRIDIQYIPEPPIESKSFIEVLGWSSTMMESNRNMWKLVGRFKYQDPSTKKPKKFNSGWAVMQPLITHLLKNTGEPFSGKNSGVYGYITNSEELIPYDNADREDLTIADCNYFAFYDSINTFAVDEDSNTMPGVDTSVKRFINNFTLNRVIKLSQPILSEHKILLNDPKKWIKLQNMVNDKISRYNNAVRKFELAIGYDASKPSDIENGIPSCFINVTFEHISKHIKLQINVQPNLTNS
ncbi:MAG: hypothetical protein ACRCX2_20325 [Paraclostridium sp.]